MENEKYFEDEFKAKVKEETHYCIWIQDKRNKVIRHSWVTYDTLEQAQEAINLDIKIKGFWRKIFPWTKRYKYIVEEFIISKTIKRRTVYGKSDIQKGG